MKKLIFFFFGFQKGCFLLISPIYHQHCRLLCVFLFSSLHLSIILTMRSPLFLSPSLSLSLSLFILPFPSLSPFYSPFPPLPPFSFSPFPSPSYPPFLPSPLSPFLELDFSHICPLLGFLPSFLHYFGKKLSQK